MTPRFAGKTALINGAGTGIGAATARRLAAEGANIVAMGRRADPLEAVAGPIGGEVFAGDAANAGGHGFGTIVETDDAEWQAAKSANLDTSMLLLRTALPALQKTKGAICVTASIASLAAPAGAFGYTVMKHAQIGLVRAIARDFGRDGVRCNAVCPGWVTTEMTDAEMDELMTRTDLPARDAAYAHVSKDVPLAASRPPERSPAASRFSAHQRLPPSPVRC